MMPVFNSPFSRFLTLLVLLLSGAPATPAAAGARLQGRVLDESGGAIAGATVRLSSREGFAWSSVTDPSGAYSFDRLKAGDYALEIDAHNFRRQVETLRLDSQEDRALDVTMRAAGVDEQVIVTATGSAQSIDETSKSVTVVDNENIERRD